MKERMGGWGRCMNGGVVASCKEVNCILVINYKREDAEIRCNQSTKLYKKGKKKGNCLIVYVNECSCIDVVYSMIQQYLKVLLCNAGTRISKNMRLLSIDN